MAQAFAMDRSAPRIRPAAVASAGDLKLIFRAAMRFLEYHRRDGHDLASVVLAAGARYAILFIHEHLGLWDTDAATQVADGIGIGIVAASVEVEGHAEDSARLPDDVGPSGFVSFRQQVIRSSDSDAVVNPEQLISYRQAPLQPCEDVLPRDDARAAPRQRRCQRCLSVPGPLSTFRS